MANEQNLIPGNKRTPSERRELARKAGIASGKKRQEKVIFRDLFQQLLNEEYKDGMTNAQAIAAAQIIEALGGNTKAFAAIRDTIGQKPVEQVEDKVSGGITIGWGNPECK